MPIVTPFMRDFSKRIPLYSVKGIQMILYSGHFSAIHKVTAHTQPQKSRV